MIRSVKRAPNHGFKIHCASAAEAEELRSQNWETALDGTSAIRPTYGVVVHRAPKHDIDPQNDTQEDMKARIEHANNGCFTVVRTALLRRRARNPQATTQSIVILLGSLEEANECILSGINIEHRHYAADRHTPQCQIKQCFNCQEYGHKAEVCTKKARCGKCAQEHETRKCKSDTTQCTHCKESHTAWHHACPARMREKERMEALRDRTPPLFVI